MRLSIRKNRAEEKEENIESKAVSEECVTENNSVNKMASKEDHARYRRCNRKLCNHTSSWYIDNQAIRNTHYSRHPQVEQRIKANHKCQNVANGSIDNETAANGTSAEGSATDGFTSNKNATEDSMKDNSLSLSSTEIDKANIAHQTDGQTIEQRDEYTSKYSEPVSSDYSNDDNGREKELFNDGVEPTTSNEGSLSPSITLTDAASGANSIENVAQPSTGLSNESNTDATATAPTETVSDNAG